MSCKAFPRPRTGIPTACTRHMPFREHRTVAEVWRQQAGRDRAEDFGFDPDSLKAKTA